MEGASMNWESFKREIETLIKPSLLEEGLNLYTIREINDFGGPGIEILVTAAKNPDQPLNFALLSALNEKISAILDQSLQLSDRYYLVVGTRGIEYGITSESELIQAIDKRVAIDLITSAPDKNLNHFEGIIKAYDPKTKLFSLEFFVKGQKRKMTFTWTQVRQVRHLAKV